MAVSMSSCSRLTDICRQASRTRSGDSCRTWTRDRRGCQYSRGKGHKDYLRRKQAIPAPVPLVFFRRPFSLYLQVEVCRITVRRGFKAQTVKEASQSVRGPFVGHLARHEEDDSVEASHEYLVAGLVDAADSAPVGPRQRLEQVTDVLRAFGIQARGSLVQQ